ncbi:MAG: hypothetical protein BM564_05515 [Bacteroidetes bacterium MedPE-SWsnd-G2]|nr:MAG: hypothetical protein BM564_05515 [Bacteroidetes bacterium MedPE-SWsnd-G2]
MKFIYGILIGVLLFGCTPSPSDQIEHISGYWEIEEVILEDGTKRAYTYNPTIDYIEINDSLFGFRKKLSPKFDGTFITSKDQEILNLRISNDSLYLDYTTKFDSWTEVVLQLDKTKLVTKNPDKVTYLYKRYTPIEID